MKRWLKIIAVLVVVAAAALAFAMSHNAACPSGPTLALAQGATPMKAAVYRCYGPPEVVQVEDVAKPAPADDEVLVRVRAAGLNPVEWHYVRGEPYLMRLGAGLGRPKEPRLGVDFSGTVEAVGPRVTKFKPGDPVFGAKSGALAEYVTVSESRNVLPKPERISFEQAGGVAVAAVTALQALRDKGQLGPGQRVLINGASGGVGTFAVQIAKALGAEVTGVCSTRNVELVRSIGADHVIDYTKQDFTAGTERYDLVVDNVGNHTFGEIRRVLEPTGRYVVVGGTSDDPWLGALVTPLKAMLVALFVKQTAIFFIASLNPGDLAYLAGLMSAGKVTPVVDRRYPLDQVVEALGYLEQGHARGKVIVEVAPGGPG
ncbi:MAG: NAD(P)-dependent alcohol dehydrogenase [Steroidobacteraceae bacterium]